MRGCESAAVLCWQPIALSSVHSIGVAKTESWLALRISGYDGSSVSSSGGAPMRDATTNKAKTPIDLHVCVETNLNNSSSRVVDKNALCARGQVMQNGP